MLEKCEDLRLETVLDEFNSEHFGLRMGELRTGAAIRRTDGPGLRRAVSSGVEAARREGFQHLTCRVDTSDKGLAAALTGNGFQIADTLVTYCFWFGNDRLPAPQCRCVLEDCREEDMTLLREVARTSFQMDRFHSDPALPDELCDAYYEKWFVNSCKGFADKVLAARSGGAPVGFATGKHSADDPFVHMGLIAVSAKARGLGAGSGLEAGILRWAEELAAADPAVKGFLHGTQINNTAMQRILVRMGFVPYASQYVLRRLI